MYALTHSGLVTTVGKNSSFPILDVLYGIFHSSCPCAALNHLIMIGKYYLHINTGAKNNFQICEFISLVNGAISYYKKNTLRLNQVKKIIYLKNGISYKIFGFFRSVLYFSFFFLQSNVTLMFVQM